MSIAISIANLLTVLAFFIHTFTGDKELGRIRPDSDSQDSDLESETWTMARCGWHWISFDLLFTSIGLGLINFTDYFANEKLLLQILSVYFFGYAIVWALTIAISKRFPYNYLKLGQWILLLVISGLIYLGI